MLKILNLGDSYTCGEGLEAPSSWPHLLVRELHKKEVPVAEPQVIAQTGWTSSELQLALNRALAEQKLSPPYDLVTLLIGVNNQYRQLELTDYTQEFETLLQQAIQLANGTARRVFVLSIPDWSVIPFAEGREREPIAREIDAFNRENARLTYAAGAQYLNLSALCRLARRDPELLAADGLHYSEKMYRRWVLEILPRIWHTLLPDKNIHIPLIYQRSDI